jgi:hypothetical protein
MEEIAARLAVLGWKLRSGAAIGADMAFERGARSVGGRIEIYLPWSSFMQRERTALGWHGGVVLAEPTTKAREIGARHHPWWPKLPRSHRALVARNSHQILGADCSTPAAFALLWSPGGEVCASDTIGRRGGTLQAVRVAGFANCPLYNLRRAEHRLLWEAWLAVITRDA